MDAEAQGCFVGWSLCHCVGSMFVKFIFEKSLLIPATCACMEHGRGFNISWPCSKVQTIFPTLGWIGRIRIWRLPMIPCSLPPRYRYLHQCLLPRLAATSAVHHSGSFLEMPIPYWEAPAKLNTCFLRLRSKLDIAPPVPPPPSAGVRVRSPPATALGYMR